MGLHTKEYSTGGPLQGLLGYDRVLALWFALWPVCQTAPCCSHEWYDKGSPQRPTVDLVRHPLSVTVFSMPMTTFYELVTLIPGSLTDQEVQAIADAVRKHLEDHQAVIHKHGLWERRKLAYEVNHVKQGAYLVSEFDMDPAQLRDLEHVLLLEKQILRHQVIKAHKKTAREIEQEAKRKAEERTPRGATVKEVAPAEPMSKEALEEKLENILTDDMTK